MAIMSMNDLHYATSVLQGSVRAQTDIECRASVNCNDVPGDVLERVATGSQCCLDNPNALAFRTAEGTCEPCVGKRMH